ncbi:cGMP-specific 3',5'-cGMP phosphodiesterase 3 [Zancudomyces culisetae]|uniref:cGMP-specific 3',5'-cGMP phosphodiesterase 3 n=1 Tax=Zancudomyces culisetae TaxID=1213189 RepID=A0A1R1PVY4_ZANCU|nr:cGMP-specific 3',5'-cGMP phosphodiesterase 3 [Zancudomyces culisetae]|eukprot:OMH85125.1 cGMP-specific 3',5'-cGMP phosphodiesterase 3 [Zancudomyces culisetae]
MIQGYLDNPYHNLWHAVDTCQSTFYILHILDSQDKASPLFVNADFLNPMDRFVLILSCLGHDLGHPGLTNKLMSDTNSPLSILFNDQSILENYHLLNLTIILSHVDSLTAGSDLANIYAAKNKELAISIILATDMARHSQYVDLLRTRAEILDRKNANASGSDYSVPSSKHSSVSWLSSDSFEDKKLLCALIMKCSDISNTARPFKISERWAIHFSDEMSNQTKFECSLGLASLLTHDSNSNSNSTLNSNDGSCENQLVGRNEDCNTATNLSGLSSSQVVFYNTFSIPLFKAAGDLIPALSFMYKQSLFNCETWKNM